MKLNNRSGLGLIETIIAFLVSITVFTYGAQFLVYIQGTTQHLQDRFTAINLAASQIEDLREIVKDGYSNPSLVDDGTVKTTSLTAIPAGFDVTYTVEDRTDWQEDDDASGNDTRGPEYKIITVTATYKTNRQIVLKTLIIR